VAEFKPQYSPQKKENKQKKTPVVLTHQVKVEEKLRDPRYHLTVASSKDFQQQGEVPK
jgi:hypothetical protein